MHLNAFCAEDAEQGNTLTCLLSSSLGSHEYCGRSAVITNRGHFFLEYQLCPYLPKGAERRSAKLVYCPICFSKSLFAWRNQKFPIIIALEAGGT